MVALPSTLELLPYSQPRTLGRFDRGARTKYVPPNPIGAKSKRFLKTALRAHETVYEIRVELVAVTLEIASSYVDLQIQSQWIQYNGESFDSRIGQLYLRARWYDMHRFTTLDPYAGNAQNPLSFNKYGFVHANSMMGTDPSGRSFFALDGTGNWEYEMDKGIWSPSNVWKMYSASSDSNRHYFREPGNEADYSGFEFFFGGTAGYDMDGILENAWDELQKDRNRHSTCCRSDRYG